MIASTFRNNRTLTAIVGLLSQRFKILAYHSVFEISRDTYEINASEFEKQMMMIADKGFRVVSLEESVQALLNGDIEPKTIVITFDDGFQSLLDFAFPIMKQLNFPATVFLPFDYIGGIDAFSYDLPRPDFRILSYQEIEESLVQNISYGSHTMSHSDLTFMDKRSLERELRESKQILNGKLRTRFSALAYPFGLFNEKVEQETASAGYDCAVCFGNVLSNSRYVSPFQLKREKILNTTTLDQFERLIDVRYDFVRKVKKYL